MSTTDWKEKYKAEVAKRKQINDVWREQYTALKESHEELQQYKDDTEAELPALREDFKTIVEVFASLIELSHGVPSGFARKVADHAMILAISLGENKQTCDDIFYAALLHDIGKYGLPDEIIGKEPKYLMPADKEVLKQTPWMSQTALTSLVPLRRAGKIILHHKERLDGSGYPKKLKSSRIPFTAQILGVVVDYHSIVDGKHWEERVKPEEAAFFLKDKRSIFYNVKVVNMFLKILDFEKNQLTRTELRIYSDRLEPGMVLSRPLLSSKGLLLLPKHHKINEDNIISISNLEEDNDEKFAIFIKRGVVNVLKEDQKGDAAGLGKDEVIQDSEDDA